MTDAERLMRTYVDLVAQSPSRIAPERADVLLNQIYRGSVADLGFTTGQANFEAVLGVPPRITASFSALLSLWAVARGSLQIAQAVADARRAGQTLLNVDSGTLLYEGHQLVAAAQRLIENPDAPWPSHLPIPQPAATSVPNTGTNNLFLGAVGWVTLHEIAHIHLQHEVDTIDDIRRRQEFEADLWATKWILDEAAADQREFRIFCIATGLVWLGLLNTVRRSTITHPPAAQRLLNCTGEFLENDLSPALEMAGDVLKVVFDPAAELPPSEHPADAFVQVALHLRRIT